MKWKGASCFFIIRKFFHEEQSLSVVCCKVSVISGIEAGDIREVSKNLGNVLESVTVAENPVINDIKAIMLENGAMSALMSGSGPTVFGLFGTGSAVQNAYGCLERSGYAPQLFITDIYDPGE